MGMHKRKKGELGFKILYAISVGVMIPTALVVPNVPKAFMPLLRELAKKFNTRPQSFRRSLTTLKQKRLLSIQEKGEEVTYVLSEGGKLRVVRGRLDELVIKQPRKWDGKWRIVLFDIPEKHKAAREALRGKLNSLGFYQIQKSCFVYPHECRAEIDFVTECFMISQHVMYVVAESLEGEGILKKHFQL